MTVRLFYSRLLERRLFYSRLLERRVDQFGLLVITLLAWGLRLHRLGAQSLWYDEGVTATLAQRTLADLTQWTARDIQPPLYYYVVWGWGRLAGWSEWNLRFPSAFWALLAVPLLALLAQRLTGRRWVGLMAALLVATHPLLVYYSQEARMYTMLVTLTLLAGYLLLRLCDTPSPAWHNWLGYGLIATLALYTHYFAFFWLIALGVAFWVEHFARQQFAVAIRDPRLFGFGVTHLLVALGYLVWLAPLFQQFTRDASYWQGRLKLWEALRGIAFRFSRGETVLEATGKPLLLAYGFMTLFLLSVLLWQARTDRRLGRTLLYALCWLIIPLVGVLGLAAFVPKFNARYVLIALPGLLLLWSSGVGLLIADGFPAAGVATPVGLLRSAMGLLCALLLLNGFRMANQNWFADPAFTKAQWREVATYVRTHRQPDEAIVLVSGHAWPIWHYYAPDLPAIRLPDLEILDVNAVLDFANTGDVLRTTLEDKKGVWLINWQADVVDPNGVVTRQLLRAATEAPINAEFWQVHLRHFVDLEPSAILTTPPIDHVLAANFGDQLQLQGYTVAPDGDLLLFWQLGRAPPMPRPDLHINLRTMTATDLHYADPADRRPADYGFPVMRWQPGQLVMGRIPATEWAGPGALPGSYQVQLGVYDPAGDPAGLDLLDPAGNPTGKFVLLAVNLAHATSANDQLVPEASTEIVPGVQVGFSPEPLAAEPGQTVALTLHWLLENQLQTMPELLLQWRTEQGTTWVASAPLPMQETVPMTTWPVGQWVRQIVAIQPPLHLSADDYELSVLVKDATRPSASRPFTILSSSRNFTPPLLALPLEQNFVQPEPGTDGDPQRGTMAQVRLLGLLQTISTTVSANAQLPIDLVWQAAASVAPAADYVVTLQLLGGDGRPIAQRDQPLPGGSTNWLPGQVEVQTLTLSIPPEPGDYRLIVALYHTAQDGFPRLITPAGNDFVQLGAIRVAP